MLHRPLYRRKAGYSFIRSLNPAAWFRADTGVTVTGLGASMVADQADSDNALVLPGVAGNYAGAGDVGDVAGDIDVRIWLSLDDWTPAANVPLLEKLRTAGQRCYDLYATTTGGLIFRASVDGTAVSSATSSATHSFTNGQAYWVRATRASSSGDVTFYTSPDGSTWTQLGAVQSTTAGAIFNGTDALYVAGQGGAGYLSGKVYRAIIKSGIDGTTVFDANFAAQTKGTTSFSESSSNAATVTVNQSGALPAHIGSQKDLLQGTDASRPPYLSYSGTKYLYLPGASGNNASAPDPAAWPTGDIDIRVRVTALDWTPTAVQVFAAKDIAGQFSCNFYLNTTGAFIFRYSNDGTSVVGRIATSSATNTFTDGDTKWVRVTYANATGKVNFYYAADSETEPASWTALGTEQTITSGTIFNGTALVAIGSASDGSSFLSGRIYRASIYSTIGGTTPVVDFNPGLDGSDQAASFTSSATGELWTVNSSGGLPAQIVGRPSLLFDGSADYLKCNAFTLNQPETVYIAFKQVSWTVGEAIFDGNGAANRAVLEQKTGGASPALDIYAGSFACSNSGLPVGTYGVAAVVFNGAASSLGINLGSEVTGNAGAQGAGGFTLGSTYVPSSYSNIQVLEVIIAAAAHSAEQRARVIQYLSGRHGIAL